MMAAVEAATQETCNALVMSGGGTNGAWESGVLWGLLNYGNPDDYKWDVVTGVSIGSVNSAYLAMYEVGDEKNAVEELYKIWGEITTSDIYKEFPEKYLAPLTRSSLYDTSPGFSTLRTILAPFSDYKRKMSLSAVDIGSGEIVNMTDANTKKDNLYQSVIASASVPGAFPPTVINGLQLVDGMTAYNTNIQEAVDRCLEVVDDYSKITIDVMICDLPSLISPWTETGNTYDNFMRSREINGD